jgi:transcriptional regulator GlxA family with amidase domain
MAASKHLRIGVFIPRTVQLLDISPIDLFGMLDPKYLAECKLSAPLIATGIPSTIHYIPTPTAGSHIELTAGATLQVSKTIQDPEVQAGKLDILLVPGPDPSAVFEEEVLEFVSKHAGWRGKNGETTVILSICTGCIVLGQSGVLKGRKATGPRAIVPQLEKDFPEVQWVDDKRWVHDGNIWSSSRSIILVVSSPVMQLLIC